MGAQTPLKYSGFTTQGKLKTGPDQHTLSPQRGKGTECKLYTLQVIWVHLLVLRTLDETGSLCRLYNLVMVLDVAQPAALQYVQYANKTPFTMAEQAAMPLVECTLHSYGVW